MKRGYGALPHPGLNPHLNLIPDHHFPQRAKYADAAQYE